jgi:hypothetical protein
MDTQPHPRLLPTRPPVCLQRLLHPADQVGGVVAQKCAAGRGGDDQRQVEAACRSHHACGDRRSLARHHRHEYIPKAKHHQLSSSLRLHILIIKMIRVGQIGVHRMALRVPTWSTGGAVIT